MAYELTTNTTKQDAAIIARILGGEVVYGAFLRGTGKIYMKMEIHVIQISAGEEAGKLALSAGLNTHNGQIQERFSRLICEWSVFCERANEINRGAPMTDAEKAEQKRRRDMGVIAAGREAWHRNLATAEAELAEAVKMETGRDYAAYLVANGSTFDYVGYYDRLEADKPGEMASRLHWHIERAKASVKYAKAELVKLDKREAKANATK